jgi:hypothetical protein
VMHTPHAAPGWLRRVSLTSGPPLFPPTPPLSSTHGADVIQTVHALLVSGGLAARLNHLDLLALIVACAVHDVGECARGVAASCARPVAGAQGAHLDHPAPLNHRECTLSLVHTGHPGVNNSFLVNSEDEEALLRNDSSVLEVSMCMCA